MSNLSQDGLARLADLVVARPELDERVVAVLHELQPTYEVLAAVIAGARAGRGWSDVALVDRDEWKRECRNMEEEKKAAEEKCRALAQELKETEAVLALARARLESAAVVACEVRAAIGQMLQGHGHIMTQDEVARCNSLLWRLEPLAADLSKGEGER